MQANAQSKTNELLGTLAEALVSSTTFSEFEICMYKREAEKLPEKSQTHLILSLLYATQNKKKLTVLHANKAMEMAPYDEAIFTNVLNTLIHIGAPVSINELIKNCSIEHYDFQAIANILVANLFINDLDLQDKIKIWLEKTNQFEKFHEFTKGQLDSTHKRKTLQYIQENLDITPEQIHRLSMLASEVVESSNDVRAHTSRIVILPEQEGACITYYLECKPTEIFDLNWDLSMLLIEHELNRLPITARFELVHSYQEPSLGAK